jgi:hypothetical protein
LIENILSELPLVGIYWRLHVIFDESFCNSKKTAAGNGPDMAKTYTEFLETIISEGTQMKVTGRRSELDAGGMANEGILSIRTASKSSTTAEGESDDLQASVSGEAEFDGEDLMLDVV